MSTFSFIASNHQLPEVENPKVKVITVKEAIKLRMPANKLRPWEKMNPEDKLLIVNDAEDLHELVIRALPEYDENVSWYTKKPFIYTVDFRYTEERGGQLLQYLKDHVKEGQELELWHIWLDNSNEIKSIKPNHYNCEDISIETIKKMFDATDEGYCNNSSIIIKK